MSDADETEVSKSHMHGLWALTNRELKKWYQQPFVLAMGIIQPILWLALLGKAMNIGNIVTGIPGINPTQVMMHTFGTKDYFSFMSMSMVAFTVVFTTAFVGMSVVWDKRLGFMNKVLSTPVSRSSIILSKVLAASVRAIFQAGIVAAVAFALGLSTGTNFGLVQHTWNIRNSVPNQRWLSIVLHSLNIAGNKNGDASSNLPTRNITFDVCKQRILPNCSDAQLATGHSKRKPNIIHN